MAATCGLAIAGPVGVDGTLGAEWAGITAVDVAYDIGAASSNFASPGTAANNVGYSVYYRADANYLYGAIKSNGNTGGLNFANLYFNTDLVGGSDFGIEVINNRAFQPGVAGYFDLSGFLAFAQSTGDVDHVIEFALDWSYLANNVPGFLPSGTNVANGIQLRSIQAYGYSVTGGDIAGGTRFGTLAQPGADVPEPGSAALVLAALAGLAVSVRRRHSRPAQA